ncbi:GntR family transcriptional regulator [Thermomonospora umbrina]|uniref:GntR family transcriptional regulator n=1 Tax=Thermomonospora umbrina TaxID=111806 RepID=UPI001FE94C4C|nr:GntR family transcriptional regulator [Thermomonospora umbrina]
MTRSSVVDEVTDQIAFQIASGRWEAGERLPSIRRLAAEYGINPSTVQLVLGRLRAAGFVEARQGLGVVVRDIQVHGGIETWQYLFRFSRRLPDLTVRILQDVLEALRVFYGDALRKFVADPDAYELRPVLGALQRLELVAAAETPMAEDMHRAVLQLLRSGLAMTGGGITLGVLNSLGGMLSEVPEVLDALYADPAEVVGLVRHAMTAWEKQDLESWRRTVADLEEWHAEVVRRFRAGLESSPADS